MIKMETFNDVRTMMGVVLAAIVVSIVLWVFANAIGFGRGLMALTIGAIWVLVVVGSLRGYT